MHLVGWLSFHHLVVFFSGALTCSFIWAIFFLLSWRSCYVVRGVALVVHQGRVTVVAALWCCTWGRAWEGAMVPAPLSARLQSLPPVPTIKMGPFGADPWVGGLVHTLGLCGSLQRTLLWGWESLLLPPQPPQVFSIRGLRLYFPTLEPWVVQSVSLPSCSSQFIRTWVRDHLLHQPPPNWIPQQLPCPESSPPSCPSPLLLPVWINVSSLTPWLSDFHTVWFSVSSGCFLFLNCCCPFFGCVRRHSVSPYASVLAQGLVCLNSVDQRSTNFFLKEQILPLSEAFRTNLISISFPFSGF